MSVSFHEPLSKDIAQQQNEALQKVMSIKDGETLLCGCWLSLTVMTYAETLCEENKNG